MNRVSSICVAAAILAGVTNAGAQAPASPESAKPSIVGIWSVDKDLSDRADAGGRGAAGPGGGMVGPGGGRGGRGGMGGGMPGGMGGFGGRGGDRDELRRAGRLGRDLMRPPDSLTIVTDGSAVVITADDGRSVRLLTDGREQERLTGDGAIKAKARWDGDQLIVEERIQDGPKVTRTYLASAGGRRLVVITRIDGRDWPVDPVVHHVFTRKE